MLEWLSTRPDSPAAGVGPERTLKYTREVGETDTGLSQALPAPLDTVAAFQTQEEGQEMRTLAATHTEQEAELFRLILAAPPFPTAEDAAELDALIVKLCLLEPCLAGYEAEMLAARRDMAPANYAEELAKFRRWVREAEAKHGAARAATQRIASGSGPPGDEVLTTRQPVDATQ